MRNFNKIISGGLDMSRICQRLLSNSDWWNYSNVRTWHQDSVHKGVDDIVLHYNSFDPEVDDYVEAVCANLDCVPYPAWEWLPEVQEIVSGLIFNVRGRRLGRVMISRLAPGCEIPWHSDRIKPAEAEFPNRIPPALYYDRFQIPIRARPGILFLCGEEQVEMQEGECWWFDNQQIHKVINNSDDDRISLIVDIHTRTDL